MRLFFDPPDQGDQSWRFGNLEYFIHSLRERRVEVRVKAAAFTRYLPRFVGSLLA